VEPGLRRFLAVSAGQLVSTSGSALTAWAIPVWVYLQTGSLSWFGLTGMLAFLPVLVATPLGNYNPDWAIVFDGAQRWPDGELVFVS
jgi:hypothetical protein